jgi:hypothetical protein
MYSYEACHDFAEGDGAGLFSINRTSDSKGMTAIAKRVDREAASEYLLTMKRF